MIPDGADAVIAEAGSSGGLGVRLEQGLSMEGMLHPRNKNDQASNILTRFGQPYNDP